MITPMPEPDYHAHPAFSKSQLDLVRRAPGLLQWQRNAPAEPTISLDIGKAMHCLILEPDEFDKRFATLPELNLRTNAGKAERDIFQQQNADKTIISADDMTMLRTMRESVYAHPEARALLEMDGTPELSMFWRDPETGLDCRARPDWWIRSRSIMVDLKTTDDAAKFHFSARDYRYDVQQAYYSDGAEQNGEAPDVFLFIVVGKTRSMGRYPVRVIELHPASVEAGRAEYREDLRTVSECVESGSWSGVEYMTLPERKYY